MRIVSTLAIGLLLIGCSAAKDDVVTKIEQRVDKDLARTSVMALDHGKPEVALCSDYLSAQLHSNDISGDKFMKLMNEPTDGLASTALKSALIAEFIRQAQDPASQAAFRKGFDTNCGQVAGILMMNILRDSANIAKKVK